MPYIWQLIVNSKEWLHLPKHFTGQYLCWTLLVMFEFWQVTLQLFVCYDDANNHTFRLTVENETYANTDPSKRKMAFSWWESKRIIYLTARKSHWNRNMSLIGWNLHNVLVLTRLWKLLSNFSQYKMQTADFRFFSLILFLVAAFWVLLYDVLLVCKDCELFSSQSNLFRLCNFCALKQNHL